MHKQKHKEEIVKSLTEREDVIAVPKPHLDEIAVIFNHALNLWLAFFRWLSPNNYSLPPNIISLLIGQNGMSGDGQFHFPIERPSIRVYQSLLEWNLILLQATHQYWRYISCQEQSIYNYIIMSSKKIKNVPKNLDRKSLIRRVPYTDAIKVANINKIITLNITVSRLYYVLMLKNQKLILR